MEKYVFREPTLDYPLFFALEREHLQANLGRGVEIEHVGSTAVPGLGGKGILDVLVGVKGELKGYVPLLQGAGYEFREKAGTPQRLFFQKDYPTSQGSTPGRIHVHLVNIGSQPWQEMMALRDYLRDNPEAAAQYAAVKREAAAEAGGKKEEYKARKDEFVRRTTERAIQAAKGRYE